MKTHVMVDNSRGTILWHEYKREEPSWYSEKDSFFATGAYNILTPVDYKTVRYIFTTRGLLEAENCANSLYENKMRKIKKQGVTLLTKENMCDIIDVSNESEDSTMFREETKKLNERVMKTAQTSNLHYVLFTFIDVLGAVSHRVAYFEDYFEMVEWVKLMKPKAFENWYTACWYADGELKGFKSTT